MPLSSANGIGRSAIEAVDVSNEAGRRAAGARVSSSPNTKAGHLSMAISGCGPRNEYRNDIGEAA